MARKKRRGLKKDTTDLLGASIITGVGAGVVGGLGGNTAGLTAISSRFGTLGTLIGTGAVVRQTRKLNKQKKRRKR